MNKSPSPTQVTFGFLNVQEIEGLGHCGGLLIVSQIGRPLEFHCSAPVTTNRAQAILYGKTYQTFLYCEQIGLALIEKSKTRPALFVANCAPLLPLNELQDVPTVILGNREIDVEFGDPARFGMATRPTSFKVNERTLWSQAEDSQQQTFVESLAGSFTKTLPWDEPFERIQKAIEEAQTVAR